MKNYCNIVHDYLVVNDLLGRFLYNTDNHPNLIKRTARNSVDPISYHMTWSETPEGCTFWESHNFKLQQLLRKGKCRDYPTIQELYDFLNIQPISSYEYW